ncbi:hypothetical protein HDV06_005223 [Boothiomyces sp. JEL0866]|nr:hypothetical protein HDV06_005223 [Boothiomyces sp. JEL0866]
MSVIFFIRSSGILHDQYKLYYKYILLIILVVAMGFIEASAFQGVTFDYNDYCASTINATTNLIGKMILFVIYLTVCVVFIVVIRKKVNSKSKARSAFIFGSIRVLLVVIALLISITFSFTNVWGARFFIQFTIENYFGITASTFVCQVPEKKKSSHSGSTKRTKNFSSEDINSEV